MASARALMNPTQFVGLRAEVRRIGSGSVRAPSRSAMSAGGRTTTSNSQTRPSKAAPTIQVSPRLATTTAGSACPTPRRQGGNDHLGRRRSRQVGPGVLAGDREGLFRRHRHDHEIDLTRPVVSVLLNADTAWRCWRIPARSACSVFPDSNFRPRCIAHAYSRYALLGV